jgi:hypothetical protein
VSLGQEDPKERWDSVDKAFPSCAHPGQNLAHALDGNASYNSHVIHFKDFALNLKMRGLGLIRALSCVPFGVVEHRQMF